jgi:hypothetical protein
LTFTGKLLFSHLIIANTEKKTTHRWKAKKSEIFYSKTHKTIFLLFQFYFQLRPYRLAFLISQVYERKQKQRKTSQLLVAQFKEKQKRKYEKMGVKNYNFS